MPLVVPRPTSAGAGAARVVPSPVKAAALELGLPVTDDLDDVLDASAPTSAWWSPSAGSSAPHLLDRAADGEPALLAAAPVAGRGAGRAGDPRRRRPTGVCVMAVEEGLDTGRRLRPRRDRRSATRRSTSCGPSSSTSASSCCSTRCATGSASAEPQDGEVTYAAKLDPSRAPARLGRPAVELAPGRAPRRRVDDLPRRPPQGARARPSSTRRAASPGRARRRARRPVATVAASSWSRCSRRARAAWRPRRGATARSPTRANGSAMSGPSAAPGVDGRTGRRADAAAAGVAARRVAVDALERIERDEPTPTSRSGRSSSRSALDERDRARHRARLRHARGCGGRATTSSTASSSSTAAARPARAPAPRRLPARVHRHPAPTPRCRPPSTRRPNRLRGLVNAVLRKVADGTRDVARRRDPPQLSRLDRATAWSTTSASDAFDALEAMNRAPAVTTRDDGYTQDLASQWVADAVGAGRGRRGGRPVRGARAARPPRSRRSGRSVVAVDLRPARVRPGRRRTSTGSERGDRVARRWSATRPGRRCGRRRSTACWSMPRARASACCAVAPMPAGGSSRTTSIGWPTLQRATARRGGGARPARRHARLQRVHADRAETIEVAADRRPAELDAARCRPAVPWRPWGSGALLLPQADDTDGMALFRWRVPSRR